MRVEGRTVVVTGATSGIGRATAVAMGAQGARVLLLARREQRLREVAEEVRAAGGAAEVHPVDLADREAIAECATALRGDEPAATEDADQPAATEDADRSPAREHPTVLVNAAGVGSWRSILEMEPGEVERDIAVPFLGAFNLTRELLGGMLAAGEGRVVNVESPAGYVAIPGATGYVAARFALRGFGEALHVDLYSTPVGVTSVVPGAVDTAYFRRNDNVDERLPPLADRRRLDPEEVAVELVRAVEADRRRVVLPPEMKAAVLGGRHAPGLSARANAALGWQPDPDLWAEESTDESGDR